MYHCPDCDAPGATHYVNCREIRLWNRTKRWWFTPKISYFELFLISFIIALIKAAFKWVF